MAGTAGAAADIDPGEIARFEAMAAEWWDPDGKFRPLHMMNPCRLGYITAQIAAQFGRDQRAERPFAGLSVLDIGCGGGLLCEPMARLGAAVTGIDPAARNIPVARLHAAEMGLAIDYRAASAQEMAGQRFDAVLNMEVVEHVPDPRAYLSACAALVKPGGLMITSTLNRTPQSFAMAIVGAEYLLRWLPRGTHDWRRFITPDELCAMLSEADLKPVDRTGLRFGPLARAWRLSKRDLSVNYVTTAIRG